MTHKLNAAYMQYRMKIDKNNRDKKVEGIGEQVLLSKGNRILMTRHPIERLISFWDNKFRRLFGPDQTKRENVMGYYADFMIKVFNITDESCLPKKIHPLKFEFSTTGAPNTWGDPENKQFHISFRQMTWFIIVVDHILRNNLGHCPVNFKSLSVKSDKLAWQYFYMHIGQQFEQCRVCEIQYDYKVNLRHLKEDFLPIYARNKEFEFLYTTLEGDDSEAIVNKGTGTNMSGKSVNDVGKLIRKYLEELKPIIEK